MEAKDVAFFEALISFHPEKHSLISDGVFELTVAEEEGHPTLLVNNEAISLR